MLNYYDILELKSNCSQNDIKKSFKRLALIHHPDKSGNSDEHFKKIVSAYEILSDPIKRDIYDINYRSSLFLSFDDLINVFINYYVGVKEFKFLNFIKHLYSNENYDIKKIKKIVEIYQMFKCSLCHGKKIMHNCNECHKNDEIGIICDNNCGKGFKKFACFFCCKGFRINSKKKLEYEYEINLYQWLFGGVVEYKHINGEIYNIQFDGYTTSKNMYRLVEELDVYINFVVNFSEDDVDAIRNMCPIDFRSVGNNILYHV